MRIKTCLALALASAFSISAAVGTTLERLDRVELAKRASVAIVGEVITSRSAQTDAGFKTIATVKVERSVWGTDAATIDVEVPGGRQQIGKFKIGETVPGAPTFIKGERFILMLTRPSGSENFTVVGLNQGMFSVVKTAQGDAVMLPGAGKLIPVSEAMREIQAARTQESSNVLR